MKICVRCGIEQTNDQFRMQRAQCRKCQAIQRRTWREANKEKLRLYDIAYNQTHKEQRHTRNLVYYSAHVDAMRQRARVYCAAHKEERNAYARQWYADNTKWWKERNKAWLAANPDKADHMKQKTNERRRRWEREHPEKARDKCVRRRARLLAASIIAYVDRNRVWERDGGKCHICGKRCNAGNWHLDHLIPLSLGGTHEYCNVAVSHPACNAARGNKGPAQLRLIGGI